MFGVDLTELIIILVVALIVFGPDKLPEIARQLGKAASQLRRTSDALRREFYNEIYPPAGEIQRELRDATRELKAVSFDFETSVKKGLEEVTTPEIAAPKTEPGSKP